MKIAICLFGKFSGVNKRNEIQDFKVPFEYLKKNILTNESDIFFHGWDDDENASKELVKLLKPKKYKLEKQKTFHTPYSNFNYIKNGPWNTKDALFNIYSRYYSLKQSLLLIDKSYDIILISRFDTIFYSKINFEIFDPNNFYVSHWNLLSEGWGFNDGWFITGYHNSKKFSEIYDCLDKYYAPKSDFVNFAKRFNLSDAEIVSGHIPWRYRLEELNMANKIYAYGLEYESWGLLRRLNMRWNPYGYPDLDIYQPVRVADQAIKYNPSLSKYFKYLIYRLLSCFSKLTG